VGARGGDAVRVINCHPTGRSGGDVLGLRISDPVRSINGASQSCHATINSGVEAVTRWLSGTL